MKCPKCDSEKVFLIVQGNPISPVLVNIALHGLQELFGAFTRDGQYILPQYKR